LYAGHRGKGRESGWESIMNETISNSLQQGGVGQGRQRPVQELTALNIFQGSLQLAQQFLLQTTPMTSQTSGLPTHCFSESFSAAPPAWKKFTVFPRGLTLIGGNCFENAPSGSASYLSLSMERLKFLRQELRSLAAQKYAGVGDHSRAQRDYPRSAHGGSLLPLAPCQ